MHPSLVNGYIFSDPSNNSGDLHLKRDSIYEKLPVITVSVLLSVILIVTLKPRAIIG